MLDATDRRPAGKDGDAWPFAERFSRLLRVHGASLDPVIRDTLAAAGDARSLSTESDGLARLAALAEANPGRPEPLRVTGLHLATRRRDYTGASHAFEQAYQRSKSPQDAYDAGRALWYVDPAAAWKLFERIPGSARGEFPRLALYQAEHALSQGVHGEAMRPIYVALQAFRDTAEGRRQQALDDTLARVAVAAGDPAGARRFTDLAFHDRLSQGNAALARANAAFTAQRFDEAVAVLAEAQILLPADPRVYQLRARVAQARGDAAAVEAALVAMRQLAPSLDAAVAAENRFRSELGLPLLPQRSASDVFAHRD